MANLDKPFIISGKYYYNPKKKLDYVTYLGIKPYVPMGVSSREICDHINIMYPDCLRYIAMRYQANYTKDYLVCRARKHIEYNGDIRGGVFLTEELGIPPVIRASYPESRKIIDSVPKNKYVDFLAFEGGKYAYSGEDKFHDSPKNRLDQMERLAEESRKQMIRGWNQVGKRAELSYNEFMKLHKNANPVWIPPPRNICLDDKKKMIKIFVPQRYLREILDQQPDLKEQVYKEFIKKTRGY